MENKKLLKFLNEIEKLDFKNLNHVSSLNRLGVDTGSEWVLAKSFIFTPTPHNRATIG